MRRRLALVAALASLAGTAAGFDLQGHRGARGLAPENTLPAFARALAIGVTTLELDIGITADGHVIVTHDRRLNPEITRGADGAWIGDPGPTVNGLTLSELRRFDVGAIRPDTAYAKTFATQIAAPGTPMPTLREVVEPAARQGLPTTRFNIETKSSPLAPAETLDPERFARALIAEIRALGIASRSSIQSFDWRTLAVAAREAPEIARVHLTIERGRGETVYRGKGTSPWTGLDIAEHGGSTPRLVRAAGGAHWSPFFRDLTPAAVAEAKSLGLTVVPWTVNQAEDLRAVIALGVDGVITDYPDRAREILAEFGRAPGR